MATIELKTGPGPCAWPQAFRRRPPRSPLEAPSRPQYMPQEASKGSELQCKVTCPLHMSNQCKL
eukprot:8946865-Pyramimonas_sp.AAC.1